MIYDLSNNIDIVKAESKFKHLVSKGCKIELTEKRKTRSISQNSYQHLLFSYYALEYGETIEYVKQYIYKQVINPDIFITEYVNKKTEEVRERVRSTSELSTKETTDAIERFKNYAVKEAGIYLPSPSDLAFLDHIKNEVENNKAYL